MPNFDAVLRASYRDIDGLVLDCMDTDLTPSVWLNRAPSHPGQPRFGNPFQDVVAQQPTILESLPNKRADFLRSASQHYKIPLVGSFGADSQRWTFAFQGLADPGVVANEQAIFGTNSTDFSILRRGPAGFEGYRHNGALVTGAAASWSGGADLFQLLGGGLADWTAGDVTTLRENNGAFSNIGFAPDVLNSAFIGRDNVGNHYDGILQSFHIWSRRLSLLEADLAYQTFPIEGSGAPVNSRAFAGIEEWHDVTGTGRQVSRLRPGVDGGAQRFWLARGPVGARVQISAMVGGVTLADADLGGDLFTMTTLEAPIAAPPVFQDAGWSAVFDVRLVNEGHHSFLVERGNGGGVVVHVDYEVA